MNMRRTTLLTVIALLVAMGSPAALAQDAYILNETGATLYLLSNPGEGGPATLSPETAYLQVPANGILPLPQDQDLVGFAFTRGSFQLPTLRVSAMETAARLVPGADGRRYLPLDVTDLDTDRIVSPSAFSELLSLPRVDNQYFEWVAREPRVARGRRRAPLGVYADFGDGREQIALGDSLLWERGGTDIEWIKGDTIAGALYIAASAYTPIARGTAFFLYLYPESATRPSGTLELPVGADANFVLLWLPGRPEPAVVGNLTSTEFFFEAQIWLDRLESRMGEATSDLTVEISSASSAAGIWEEFVLARDPFSVLFGE